MGQGKLKVSAGIDAFNQESCYGYINCINTLHAEIEGVIRQFYSIENPDRDKLPFPVINEFVKTRAERKFRSNDALGLPQYFMKYFKEVYLKDFNSKTGQIDLSRHSTAHGVAPAEVYTKTRAIQAILLLDQLFFIFV